MSNSFFWSGIDALGRSIFLLHRPERIVSLVPSQTELLVDLGVADRLVGRTRYCIHPHEKLASVPAIGGTKKVDLRQIEKLQPDLIIAEKEENPKELVDSLSALAPVYVTDVVSIPSAISMCRELGQVIGLLREADTLAGKIEAAMQRAESIVTRPERVLYLIWKKPWMAAGRETFIHACLEHIGFQNAVKATRYPELDDAALVALKPDRVFLSSEPYPFKKSHIEELQALLPDARIDWVDGELFSWYGSRMLKMPEYWRTLV